MKKYEKLIFDVLVDDIECWLKFPKYRWVYDLSRLLDSQNIAWSPFETESLTKRELNMVLHSNKPILKQPGFIYINDTNTDIINAQVLIIKGEVKNIRFISPITNRDVDSNNGDIDIRVNAFVAIHFSKYTGFISMELRGRDIYRIMLRPIITQFNDIEMRIIDKINKKKSSIAIVDDPTGRVLQEVVAS